MKTERMRQEAYDALPEFSAQPPALQVGRIWKRNINLRYNHEPCWLVCVCIMNANGRLEIEHRIPEVTEFA